MQKKENFRIVNNLLLFTLKMRETKTETKRDYRTQKENYL